MKNKTGIVIGFVLGVAGFLLLFKLIILDRTPPEDELAPGMVLIAAILNGCLFAFIGALIQKNVMKKRTSK